jgi:hypothetical protein
MECNHSRVSSLGFATGSSTCSGGHIVEPIAINRQLKHRAIKFSTLYKLLQSANHN